MKKAIIVVLDSLGVGALPDADQYGDAGSNTLVNTAKQVNGLNLPNLERLGLGKIVDVLGVKVVERADASFGKMAAKSKGKDTTTGHWEIAGLQLDHPFPTYPNGFPDDLIGTFEQSIGRKTIGNKAASGTAIIEELGKEHMQTGSPIVYTSADSVFQIAAHEEVIPIEDLYKMCEIARALLQRGHGVGRVIARPFIGEPGSFERTARRKDYSLKPHKKTVLNYLSENKFEVVTIGKVKDIFAGEGITKSLPAKDNDENVDKLLQLMKEEFTGLIFTNLVDFDMHYGHRNDASGYAQALESFDRRVPEILRAVSDEDLLIFTADHGTDPTTESTDHSREYVPLLVYGNSLKADVDLGTRDTFADVAATIGDYFNIQHDLSGQSFLKDIKN